MRSNLFLILGGLALTAPAAQAQGACDDIGRFFAQPPKIGDWAELKTEIKKGKTPAVAQIAFVGKEQRDGKPVYRMQIVSTDDKGTRTVVQALTPWDPASMTGEYDTEIVIKSGDNPAMKMSVGGKDAQPGLSDFRKECAKIKFLGEESVEVPAGTFKARHYKGPDGDTWASEQVPGWRIVKMVTDDGSTMVLTGTGTGAKNEITETPVDMKAMMGNPEAARKMMEGMKKPKDK